MRAKLKEIKKELRRRMHQPIPEQGKWLRRVVTGYFACHSVPTNSHALMAFRFHIADLWRRLLGKRSLGAGNEDPPPSRCACRARVRANLTTALQQGVPDG
jgi:hypothetical protein